MKITTINTIETSSICDNDCPYCPASKQHEHREVGFMNLETFKKALVLVKECVDQGTQRELNLFGVGEPTLNPDIVEMVRMARAMLPIRLHVHLNTNGNTMTQELATSLKEAGLTACDVTSHPCIGPDKLKKVIESIRILLKSGIPGQLSIDPLVNPNNWAGQVDWVAPNYEYECPWLKNGQASILSNGDVTVCCMDAFAQGVVGTVDTPFSDLELEEFNLCKTCHQKPPRRIIIPK